MQLVLLQQLSYLYLKFYVAKATLESALQVHLSVPLFIHLFNCNAISKESKININWIKLLFTIGIYSVILTPHSTT